MDLAVDRHFVYSLGEAGEAKELKPLMGGPECCGNLTKNQRFLWKMLLNLHELTYQTGVILGTCFQYLLMATSHLSFSCPLTKSQLPKQEMNLRIWSTELKQAGS